METGRSLPSALLWERKAELFEHSFKHPGVVGGDVLTLSFNFQSKAFPPLTHILKFKDSLKNVAFLCFCTFLNAPGHTKSTGQRG